LSSCSSQRNILCPSFSTIVQNTYGAPIRLFITGEEELSSTEGTTQGDPLAMAMYALAITPLIQALHHCQSDIFQVWYADNAMHCCWQLTIPFFSGGSTYYIWDLAVAILRKLQNLLSLSSWSLQKKGSKEVEFR